MTGRSERYITLNGSSKDEALHIRKNMIAWFYREGSKTVLGATTHIFYVKETPEEIHDLIRGKT